MTDQTTTEPTFSNQSDDHFPGAGKNLSRDATQKPDPTVNRDKPEVPGVDPKNQEEPETFSREYVEKLRKEAAENRVKAKDRDDLARELFHSRVGALGRLADPTDLPYDEKLLADLPALEAAVDDLLTRKPHLASRTPRGDIGQGATRASDDVNLADLLRQGA